MVGEDRSRVVLIVGNIFFESREACQSGAIVASAGSLSGAGKREAGESKNAMICAGIMLTWS